MTGRILVFSHDPGGANTVIPVVPALEERGYDVRLYGKNFALKKYEEAGLEAIDLAKAIPESTTENVTEWLRDLKPDVVLTATSAIDPTEKFLWSAAERLGIPSFAVLDQWINYGIRFSPYDTTQLERYAEDRRHPFLPTGILLMDELARKEAARDGLPEERLVIVGQPYFETVKKKADFVTADDRKRLRRDLGIAPEQPLFVFASEPLSQEQGEPGRDGYTEISSFRLLAEGLSEFCRRRNKNATILVRPHPRERPGNLDGVVSALPSGFVTVLYDNRSDIHATILASNVVCGMSSMFLIEAAILGKPVLSLLPGLHGENPFVLDRLGVIQSVTDNETLQTRLERLFDENFASPNRFTGIIDDPVRRVLNVIETALNRNTPS